MRAAWLALLALLALVGHARAVGDEGRFGVAECSPSSPCVHLVAHSHMDPGWRSTFDSYVSGSGNAIHMSAVLACARDPSRRFTFGDASFLVRWLESEGGDAPPENCAYVPPQRHEKNDPCGGTWLDLFRALIRERRVDVVGGGWVSHDEALTPVHLAAAQFDEGVSSLATLIGDATWRPSVAWQIDPFGHGAYTPELLAHLGYTHVVVNRVPRGARREMVRRREREFRWGYGVDGRVVVAHLLRRHYNVPTALDFKGADVMDWGHASAVLEAEARASFEGLRRGAVRSMMLIGDDFRFQDAEGTFGAWEDLLGRVGGAGTMVPSGAGRRAGSPRRLKNSAFRFIWSTPSEYFALSAADRGDADTLPKRQGSFLPYADNWPVSENTWVGSYVHRRELKRWVMASATAALDAGSLAALANVATKKATAAKTSEAARAAYLGLHHDAITGTCTKSVADDFMRWADTGEAMSRSVTGDAAVSALGCVSSSVGGNGARGKDDGPARLLRPGDGVAVHNPTGWRLSYAEVRLLTGRRVDVVDARDGRRVPTQERRTSPGTTFAPGMQKSRDDEEGLLDVVVALTDLPPLGLVRLAAVARAEHAEGDRRDAKTPRRDPPVTFESDGAVALGGAKMSIASITSPADERFGDGPYVSRSGVWHVVPVILGAAVCFVNVTIAAWVTMRAMGRRRGGQSARRRPRGLLDGTSSPLKSKARPRGGARTSWSAMFASRAVRKHGRYVSLAERSTASKPLSKRVARRFAAPIAIAVLLVFITHSTAMVSDATHAAVVRGGYHSGAWIGGAGAVVNAVRNKGKGTIGGAVVSAVVSASVAFLTLSRAPSLSFRTLVGHGLIAPRCFAGDVYTECIARFGAVADRTLPSAALKVRERVLARGPPLEVEWTALAPEDIEIVARVSPSTQPARGLRVDDGVGVIAHAWSSSRGWSTAANQVPSGGFVSLASDTKADSIGIVFSPGSAATSVAHLGGGAQLGVHRQAFNDDGHGLGASRNALTDEYPGTLSFRVASGAPSQLRRLAAENSRPPVAVSIHGGRTSTCERAEWSPMDEPMPAHVEVLAVSSRVPVGWIGGGDGAEGCPLWFRVRDIRDADLRARDVDETDTGVGFLARSLGSMGRVIMQPESLRPGEIGYVLVQRRCER